MRYKTKDCLDHKRVMLQSTIAIACANGNVRKRPPGQLPYLDTWELLVRSSTRRELNLQAVTHRLVYVMYNGRLCAM